MRRKSNGTNPLDGGRRGGCGGREAPVDRGRGRRRNDGSLGAWENDEFLGAVEVGEPRAKEFNSSERKRKHRPRNTAKNYKALSKAGGGDAHEKVSGRGGKGKRPIYVYGRVDSSQRHSPGEGPGNSTKA